MNYTGLHASDSDAKAQCLRVLSYNIQAGISCSRYRHYVTHSWKHVLPFEGRQLNLDAIARFLSDFHIVGLQEVDAGSLRSNYINQTEYLARKADFANWYAQTNRNLGHLGKHSLGLLTRMKPWKVSGHRLPGLIPGRGAMLSWYGGKDSTLVVGVLHLSLGRKARYQQIEFLAQVVDEHPYVILLGDFNCRTDSAEFKVLLRETQLHSPEQELHTYPSWLPKRGLDHILVSPNLQLQSAEVIDFKYSDHLPIAVEIRLPDALANLKYAGPTSDQPQVGKLNEGRRLWTA